MRNRRNLILSTAAIVALAEEAGLDAGDPQGALPLSERVPRRRRRGPAPVPSTKTMEQMLWDAACSIRGEKDAATVKITQSGPNAFFWVANMMFSVAEARAVTSLRDAS